MLSEMLTIRRSFEFSYAELFSPYFKYYFSRAFQLSLLFFFANVIFDELLR